MSKLCGGATPFDENGMVFQVTLPGIQRDSGSFRRMVERYWKGELSKESERMIEDRIPKEVLIGYRPIENK